jgi:hypothetical protein
MRVRFRVVPARREGKRALSPLDRRAIRQKGGVHGGGARTMIQVRFGKHMSLSALLR